MLRKYRLYLLLAAALIVGVSLSWFVFRKQEGPRVDAYHPVRAPLTETILASGRVTQQRQSVLGSMIQGTVVAVLVTEGDAVEEDQLLVQLADDEARARVEEAKAAVGQASAALDTVQGFGRQMAAKSLQQARTDAADAQKSFARQQQLFAPGRVRAARANDKTRTELRARFLGFVFQFHHLLPALPVVENVMLPAAALEGRFTRVMRERAVDLLDSVGLAERAGSNPRELSGGMQQRVAIARALMNKPSLVLADEPTGNLDTETIGSVLDLLEEVNRSGDTTFVIVTHDSSIAARCRRVVEIVDGTLVSDAKT